MRNRQVGLILLLSIVAGCGRERAGDQQVPLSKVGAQWDVCETPDRESLLLDVKECGDGAWVAVGGTTERGPSVVLRSEGGSWRRVSMEAEGRLYAVDFPTPERGYAAGYGVLLRTNDGGRSWASMPLPEDRWLAGVAFVDRDVGFVVGGEAAHPVFWKTSNGARSWSPVGTVLLAEGEAGLRDIVFDGASRLAVVGSGGVILESVDRGGTWERGSSGTQMNLRAVRFSPRGTLIAGAGGLLVRRGTDEPWEVVPGLPPSKFNDAVFVSDRLGFATDFEGRVHQSEDGGLTWRIDLAVEGTAIALLPTRHGLCLTCDGGRIFMLRVD